MSCLSRRQKIKKKHENRKTPSILADQLLDMTATVCTEGRATQLTSDTPSALIQLANLTATTCSIDRPAEVAGPIIIISPNEDDGVSSSRRGGEQVLMILLRSRPGTTWGAINHSRRHARAQHQHRPNSTPHSIPHSALLSRLSVT